MDRIGEEILWQLNNIGQHKYSTMKSNPNKIVTCSLIYLQGLLTLDKINSDIEKNTQTINNENVAEILEIK